MFGLGSKSRNYNIDTSEDLDNLSERVISKFIVDEFKRLDQQGGLDLKEACYQFLPKYR